MILLPLAGGFRLRGANPGVALILQQPFDGLTDVPLGEWGGRNPALAGFAAIVEAGFQASPRGWQKEAQLMVNQLARTLLLRDEIRERLATVANLRRSGEAQLRIITTQIEAARDRLTEHQQAARRFAESAAHADTAEAPQQANH